MLRVAGVRVRSGSRVPALALLLLSAATTAAIVIAGKHIPPWSFALMLIVAAGSFFLVLRRETKAPSLACWMVFAVTAVVMAIAVAVPPRTSNDVWAYAIYGRIVTAHNASPYVHAPQDFPNDPYYLRARRGYKNIKSVYGPVWTGLSAGVMEVADENKWAARLLFQGIAGLSVLGAMVLLWRRTKDAAVLAFAGLNPVIAASIVNGGHNDALLGLAVLGGAFAAPSSPILAGLILGAGAAIKIVGFLPLGAIALWALYRRGWRYGVKLLSSGLALVAIGYAVVGGITALRPLGRGSKLITHHSIWYDPRQWIRAIVRAGGSTVKHATNVAGQEIAIIGTVFVLVVTAIVVLSRFRKQRPERLAAASLVPYLFGAQYILPWYPGWVLPSMATSRKTLLAKLVVVQSILLFVVDPDRFYTVHGFSGAVDHAIQRYMIPLFELAVIIALVVTGIRQLRTRTSKGERPDAPLRRLEEEATSAAPG
ncbi:MAG TPA: glycosyltransferase family 87 protein [Actinomycetota bacterium]|nr:glycosyltransferase family 87 protein [Actinomycetota bacterium]